MLRLCCAYGRRLSLTDGNGRGHPGAFKGFPENLADRLPAFRTSRNILALRH
jgi:hypothetical protein